MLAGLKIAETTPLDEVAFVIDEKPTPQLVLYAHQNLKHVDDIGQAENFLQQLNLANGKLFHLNSNYEIESVRHVSAISIE